MMERTSAYWELRARIEKVVDERKDIVTNDDGYQVLFWPTEIRGYHTACELRILADILDDRNMAWDETVSRGLMKEHHDTQG